MEESNSHCFIGVDVGTGSARACIVDHNGRLLAAASHETQTWTSSPGSHEQSTCDVWQSICISVREAITVACIDAHTVLGIAFAATCSLAVFVRDSDEPVSMSSPGFTGDDHNVLLWMHQNATREADLINSLNHKSMQYLGGSISPLMALPKVLWLKNNMPKLTFEKCQFYNLHDALSFIATGGCKLPCEVTCDSPLPPEGVAIDGTIHGWSSDLLRDIGLEELDVKNLHVIGGLCNSGNPLAPGSPTGTLCEKSARELGLSTKVIVGTGVIDCYAGWIGTVGAKFQAPSSGFEFSPYERLSVVAGTSACHILASDQSGFVDGVWGPYKNFLLTGTNVMVGGQFAVGHLLQFVLETHPSISDARSFAKSRGVTIFDYLNDHLAQMRHKANAPNITYLGRHLFFYGDHFGNRSPIGDSTMTGAIVGLNGDKDLDNLAIMYYGALEFLALQTRHIISTMTKDNHKVRAIFISGSLCMNNIFIDLLSTACNLPVIMPAYIHAAVCYGSALLGALAARKVRGYPDQTLWSMMESMSAPGELFLPSQDHYMKALLDVKYQIFLELAQRQRDFRSMINAVPKEATQTF